MHLYLQSYTKHPHTCRTYGAKKVFYLSLLQTCRPYGAISTERHRLFNLFRLLGPFRNFTFHSSLIYSRAKTQRRNEYQPLFILHFSLFTFHFSLFTFHSKLETFYIFLRYCPPTSYNACVTCPSEHVFTPSINAANVFPLSMATFCNCFKVPSAVSAFAL